MKGTPPEGSGAGAVLRFVSVGTLRTIFVGALYAFLGLVVGPLSLVITGLASLPSAIGFGVLSAATSAIVGALVAIGSLVIRQFPVLVALSLGASLAPAMFFFQLASNTIALQFLISGPTVGLIGAMVARSAGLFAPDRRLGQGSWQEES